MSVPEEIAKQNRRWEELFKERKFKELGSEIYTADCQLMMAHVPLISGQEDAGKTFEAAAAAGVDYVKVETADLVVDQMHVIERGVFTMFTASGEIANKGNFVVVWKQEGGTWRILYECPVTDLQQ